MKLLHTNPEQHCEVERQLSPLPAHVDVPWHRPPVQLRPEQQSVELAQYRPDVPQEAPHDLLVPVLPVQNRELRQQSELNEHRFELHEVPPPPLETHSKPVQSPLQQSPSSKQKLPVDPQLPGTRQ